MIGITSMFIASKFEDIHPLRMLTVFEKIAHKKVPIDSIKVLELELVDCIKYKIQVPTVLDFLKQYIVDILGIEILNRTETERKEKFALETNIKIQEASNIEEDQI